MRIAKTVEALLAIAALVTAALSAPTTDHLQATSLQRHAPEGLVSSPIEGHAGKLGGRFVRVTRHHKTHHSCDGSQGSQGGSQTAGSNSGASRTTGSRTGNGNGGGQNGSGSRVDPAAAARAARASFAAAARKASKPAANVAPSAFATKGLTGTAAIDALANAMNGQTNPSLLEKEGDKFVP